MKLFYYSKAGMRISHVAGAIHLNKLPMDQIPAFEQLINIFQIDYPSKGYPLFLGQDELGNEIFLLDFGVAPDIGLQTLSFLLSTHSNPLDWKFFDVRLRDYFLTKTSAIISKLTIKKLGKIITAYSIRKCYPEIAELVKKTKELSKNFG